MLDEAIEHIMNDKNILKRNSCPNVIWVYNFCCQNAEGDCGLFVYYHCIEDEF